MMLTTSTVPQFELYIKMSLRGQWDMGFWIVIIKDLLSSLFYVIKSILNPSCLRENAFFLAKQQGLWESEPCSNERVFLDTAIALKG